MILDSLLDIFRGKGVTVPPLDGAFRPNSLLDGATAVARLNDPSDLALWGEDFLVADGNSLLRIGRSGEHSIHAAYPSPVTAIAVSPTGGIAVALSTGEIRLPDGETLNRQQLNCVTALAFGEDGSLFIANGSLANPASEWKRDLMEKRALGSVWQLMPSAELRLIKDKLAWPQGLLPRGSGLVISESWRRHLIHIELDTGKAVQLLVNIPGYPGRLSKTHDGALLSIFAPVNRMIEFVLQEDAYRKDMLSEVDPAYWIAPSHGSGKSFLEPLQCGAIKTMGIRKPWAPSRSYGLVVRLNNDMEPVESWHSRSDGQRHGIVAALESAHGLYAVSAGAGLLLHVASEE